METEHAPDSEATRRECARALLRRGDILIMSTGEGTIGRVDVYPYEDPAIADGHVTICRLRPGENLRYVVEFLRSEHGQIQMLRHVSGSTGQTELLVEHIRRISIPMPEPEVQEEVVQRMDDARRVSEELLSRARSLRDESVNTIATARRHMLDRLTEGRMTCLSRIN